MAEKEQTKMEKELTFKFPHIAKEAPDQIEEANEFCKGYKAFLNECKTERECVKGTVKRLEAAGYTPFDPAKDYAPGDKVYAVNREKAVLMTTFGTLPVKEGVRINGAHIDSPRLDLKPNPLYEKDDVAYFKTHYYGGIKKYQWGTIPMAMHGVIYKNDGTKVEISIGEKEDDPVFYISDLLPHLSGKQNKRPLSEGLKGEELNIIVGSLPYTDEDVKEPFKLMALKILNESYGITEKDFFRAEIEMVPAQKAVDIGFDRSMIGAYGQDDRVCAYTALCAEIDTLHPAYTTVTVLTDKEEIGSEGNTGMNSRYLMSYIETLANRENADFREVVRRSMCLSADVNAAYDPTFSDVYDKNNSCLLNQGCVLTKYTGSRGKSGANDASAETMAKVIAAMEKDGVYWQIGELGKVDEGGGGTIALYVADQDIDTVDLGVPILSMHSPFELSSKLDVYQTYKAFIAFYRMEP